ncbi:hypothetical protein [Streptomyces sp. NPDC058735]|uniref:hypothetical protein n=1 Tax=unclassified Streptomyces TaxID=2593676 RepID=UPI0036A9C789
MVAVITALAAYLYGPGRAARAVRGFVRRLHRGRRRGLARAGVRTGAAGRGLAEHRSWTTGVVIGVGALALVLWNHTTVAAVALVAGLALLALTVLEILAATATAAADTTLTRPG